MFFSESEENTGMYIDVDNWEGDYQYENTPMAGVDDFWDPEVWGPWSQGVDNTLSQLRSELHDFVQRIPQCGPSTHE